ncbi:FCS-Like Zinc finger 8 [Euphorbia lathyris]|uniref:FCS-Like Zinc finger 8 n=1 Tax=Euphorbia lathyris TaxID=212925 RepID=UPI003313FBAF
MIRKKTGLASTRHALMADISSIPSPTNEFRKPLSFPRLFTFKNYSESADSMMSSPTSILDTKPFFPLKNPFFSDPISTPKSPDSNPKRTWDKGIGLGIVDALNDDENLNLNPFTKLSKPESRMVLFGSQLKIQVPSLPPSLISPTESPKSPADFGIKTRNSQLGSSSSSGFSHSHSPAKKSGCGSANSGMDTPISPRVFTGCLSAIEMELSEDYTCVISYGPNPKTTHIFDDCVIESCCGIVEFTASKTDDSEFLTDGSSFSSENFLSSCFTCKKNLGHGKDIYMYRGEKAFCSKECRYQEMVLEEEMNKMDTEDIYGTC